MSNENNIRNTDNDSIDANEYDGHLRSQSPTLGQALTTFTPINNFQNTTIIVNANPLNVSSRVTIFIGKYPNDVTLQDFNALQVWMYTHTNKRASIDICQSLVRMYLHRKDEYNRDIAFNVYLICAEAYQTSGHNDQAYSYLQQAEIITKTLDVVTNPRGIAERDRKRTKTKDILMKLKFQSDFQSQLLQNQQQQASNLTKDDDFFRQLSIENSTSEQCRIIWRQIVLQCTYNPDLAIHGAQWLLSYAHRLDSHTIQHANSLYVALNLFLFDSGTDFFQKYPHIQLFQILDDIGRYFNEYGNQAKQFSCIHKMAHVWGTAAVAYHLKSDTYKYSVCACMMRVSFELLGICFRSSGIESLFILARKHAPEFFSMMAHHSHVKLTKPYCINYFRRRLETTNTCIPYSSAIVDEFVVEIFNNDMTNQ